MTGMSKRLSETCSPFWSKCVCFHYHLNHHYNSTQYPLQSKVISPLIQLIFHVGLWKLHTHTHTLTYILGEVVVQWLAFGYANLGSQVWVPIFAGHFSLVLPPSGQGLTKLLPYTVLRQDLQWYMQLRQWQAIASHVLNIKRECRKSRRHYKKYKTCTTNGQEAVHPSLHEAYRCHRFVM